ncbi:MAG: Crp/Fnr family transcriptional regulator [Clostridiales bacterium]|nr:Crp/Fnr family transcriptional regulator [Clostridiales bacterium]
MIIKKYFEKLRQAPLFNGISAEDLESLLDCVSWELKTVRKNEVLLLAGEKPSSIGVVLSGLLHIVKEDYNGNQTLVASVLPRDTFGEAVCYADVDESPVTIFAAEESTVMLLKYDYLVHVCPHVCKYHQQLIENMLHMVAMKNLYLQDRMEIISIKSIRAKVLYYLKSLASKQGRDVVLPFNQTKLAEYLCVDRSALAHELGRMKKDGLIDYRKNVFTLNS